MPSATAATSRARSLASTKAGVVAFARTLLDAVNRLDRSIAATQLGITLASLGLGWVGEPALARLLEPLFAFVNARWVQLVAAHSAAITVAFLLITFMDFLAKLVGWAMSAIKRDLKLSSVS